MTYVTKQGDMLDAICFGHYRREAGFVELVLEANRHLADLGPVYEAGVAIELPELPPAKPGEAVRLWS